MKKMKKSAANIIRMVLHYCRGRYMAVHEITASARLQGHYISDNAAASRVCIDLKGETISRYRMGTRYKEWAIPLSTPITAPKSQPRAAGSPL